LSNQIINGEFDGVLDDLSMAIEMRRKGLRPFAVGDKVKIINSNEDMVLGEIGRVTKVVGDRVWVVLEGMSSLDYWGAGPLVASSRQLELVIE
jgi:hypothetical protein